MSTTRDRPGRDGRTAAGHTQAPDLPPAARAESLLVRRRSATSPCSCFLPLVGIVWTVLKAGWHMIARHVRERRRAARVRAHGDHHRDHRGGHHVLRRCWWPGCWCASTSAGKGFLNALVDLPFALSPVTVGLAAVLLFGRGGWFEPWFDARGIQIMYALPAMVLVTIFISLPFTIREVQPVLEELGKDEEDASRTLGASISQTFRKVTLPNIRWALLYGIALSTARAIGEIGAVLLVSGNIQGKTETATLTIYNAVRTPATGDRLHRRADAGGGLHPPARRHRGGQASDQKGEDHMTQPIVVEQLTKRFGDYEAVSERLVHRARGRRSRPCWVRAAPARARSCARSRAWRRPPPGGSGWATRSSPTRASSSARSASCSSTTRSSGT